MCGVLVLKGCAVIGDEVVRRKVGRKRCAVAGGLAGEGCTVI